MSLNSDIHAHECYSCEFGSQPPATTPQCRGCINRDSRPKWVARKVYAEEADAAIQRAMTAARSPTEQQPKDKP